MPLMPHWTLRFRNLLLSRGGGLEASTPTSETRENSKSGGGDAGPRTLLPAHYGLAPRRVDGDPSEPMRRRLTPLVPAQFIWPGDY